MGLFDDLSSAATTATQKVSQVVSTSSALTGGMNAVSNSIGTLQKAAANGLTNLGTSALSNLAGQATSLLGAGNLSSSLGALTALQQKLSSIVDLGDISKSITAKSTKVDIPLKPPFPNVLHNYASYNYIFTLSVLDPASINFPSETYKKGKYGPILLKSGSGNPENRVNTAFGKFDFYMDNLQISSVINLDRDTGNTNATNIRFRITEPYSMGLFFQSLQTAALQSGYNNYLDIPILLTIEFKGHLNTSDQGINADSLTIEKTTKHIPMKLKRLEMKVTGKGAEYDVEAFPWNEKGFSSTYLDLKTDISITGKTVHEMLQTGKNSLQVELNKRLEEGRKKKLVKVPDQIVISFPADLTTGPVGVGNDDGPNSATINPKVGNPQANNLNERLGLKIKENGNGTLVQDEADMNPLGKSGMGFDLYRPGDPPFAKDDLTWDEEKKIFVRGNISINPTEGQMKFAQGTDIVNTINQVILMSDYGRQALKSTQLTESGKINWWRVETQVYTIPSDANMTSTGQQPKLIVYRVVPFAIDASRFMPPNTANPKIEAAKRQAMKKYDYIYTGKNLDILNFDINLKAGFYNALNADGGKNNEGIKVSETSSPAGTAKASEPGSPTPGGSKPVPGDVPVARVYDQGKTETGVGGSSRDTPETIAARQFQSAVLKGGADMIQLSLTILGDPYYLGDSGLGNYTAGKTQWENITSDYSIDYQTGEVDIIVNFRTPIDIDVSKGAYNFGPTKLVSEFSGLYNVTRVENSFAKGRFTQTLSLNRRIGQTTDESAVKSVATPTPLSISSESVVPPVYAGTQQFDDGSAIQTFDDGSQLITDADGNISSTPATDATELRTPDEIKASADLAGFDG